MKFSCGCLTQDTIRWIMFIRARGRELGFLLLTLPFFITDPIKYYTYIYVHGYLTNLFPNSLPASPPPPKKHSRHTPRPARCDIFHHNHYHHSPILIPRGSRSSRSSRINHLHPAHGRPYSLHPARPTARPPPRTNPNRLPHRPGEHVSLCASRVKAKNSRLWHGRAGLLARAPGPAIVRHQRWRRGGGGE